MLNQCVNRMQPNEEKVVFLAEFLIT